MKASRFAFPPLTRGLKTFSYRMYGTARSDAKIGQDRAFKSMCIKDGEKLVRYVCCRKRKKSVKAFMGSFCSRADHSLVKCLLFVSLAASTIDQTQLDSQSPQDWNSCQPSPLEQPPVSQSRREGVRTGARSGDLGCFCSTAAQPPTTGCQSHLSVASSSGNSELMS